ncbi:hypothetical protein [Dysgonomonas sp. BGC7]|uniref:hypothetical protein n=1 Tax=Dysgonomonas sp. BGC7 TaxID=1658008 RepID=UPI000680DE35|nr:hypothetical protein [Dysgonomonas sp. BGC7]MBD8390427.1 hypothetical protein [Dysgonomonas sp. BGC7]
MKQLIKNLCYPLIAVLLFSACGEEDKSISAPEIVGAKLVSFGFYVEDNEGVLDKDYVVDGPIVGSDIEMKIPSKIDKSSLIARFTTSEDNPAVTVKGTVQVSQQTANDFSIPVDFVLTNNSQNNRKYTVRIKRPIEWVKKVRFSEFQLSDAILKVNPVDDVPYVMGITNASNSENRKTVLLKYENETWSMVGDTISNGRPSDIDFTFNSTGTPYVVYTDYTNTIPQTATVQYYDGSSWVVIGRNYNDVRVSYNSICFDAMGKLYVFSMNNAAGGVVGRRLMNISTYNGGSWTTNQTMPGRNYNTYNMRSILKKDILYLGVYDYANDKGTISVYINQNGVWTTLAQGMRMDGATEINYNDLDMDVDNQGNIYIMGLERFDSGYKLVNHKYTASTSSWSIFATPIDLIGNTKYFSIGLNPDGGLSTVYNNLTTNSNSSFVTIDKESQTWTSPFIFPDILNTKADMAFASDGTGYIIYIDASKHLAIWEYIEDNE